MGDTWATPGFPLIIHGSPADLLWVIDEFEVLPMGHTVLAYGSPMGHPWIWSVGPWVTRGSAMGRR